MQIFIKALTGKTYCIEIKDSKAVTALEIKSQIQEQEEGIDISNLILFVAGRAWDNNQTYTEFSCNSSLPSKVTMNATLHLIIKSTQQLNSEFQDTKLGKQGVEQIQEEIDRLVSNSKCFFSIGNKKKIQAIQEALHLACQSDLEDVRQDPRVKAALGMHRIFSFFGTKIAKSLLNVESSCTHKVFKQ